MRRLRCALDTPLWGHLHAPQLGCLSPAAIICSSVQPRLHWRLELALHAFGGVFYRALCGQNAAEIGLGLTSSFLAWIDSLELISPRLAAAPTFGCKPALHVVRVPNSVQLRPISAQTGRPQPSFRPMLYRGGPTSADAVPNLTESRPKLSEIGRRRSTIGRSRSRVGQIWPKANSGRSRLKIYQCSKLATSVEFAPRWPGFDNCRQNPSLERPLWFRLSNDLRALSWPWAKP